MATFISISYPTLQQDPNLTTHFLLAQISQQLSNANTNNTSNHLGPSIQLPFSPSTSVVFVNTVWFLSLVISLICALLATLLQQWARRYLEVVERNNPPHIRAHIREFFSRGVRKFVVIGIVDLLPFLFSVSIFLFFAGLVVFAFLANQTVAYFTLAIVGILSLSYLSLTLMPFIFHDCPYYTPLTPVLWSCLQIVGRFFFSTLHRAARQLYHRWGAVDERLVVSLHQQHKRKVTFLSKGMRFELEISAKRISMDIYKDAIAWTLYRLDQDHELEEFVDGIPGLYESNAFSMGGTEDSGDVQSKLGYIRLVLAVLPGPTSSDMPLPWSIIHLAQRSIISNLLKPIQHKRTQVCLRALYYIPGAIRDVLATYAAGEHYCMEILPLLNSPESLQIIEELWDTPNDDVALSVRCAAAAVASFMITPPLHLLENFVSPDFRLIRDDDAGEEFLAERIRISTDANGGVAPEYLPRNDSARLQNIARFLTDITNTLQYMNTQCWTSDKADSIRRERRVLYDARRTIEFRTGQGTFEQQGNRASDAFIPAAQQDLIALTLEILARDPVGNAGRPQRKAFRDACHQLWEVAVEQARIQMLVPLESVSPASRSDFEARVLARAQAADVIDLVQRA